MTRNAGPNVPYASFHIFCCMHACSQNGGTETVEIMMARARALEHRQNYGDAIEVYLQVDNVLVPDLQKLQQVLPTKK